MLGTFTIPKPEIGYIFIVRDSFQPMHNIYDKKLILLQKQELLVIISYSNIVFLYF